MSSKFWYTMDVNLQHSTIHGGTLHLTTNGQQLLLVSLLSTSCLLITHCNTVRLMWILTWSDVVQLSLCWESVSDSELPHTHGQTIISTVAEELESVDRTLGVIWRDLSRIWVFQHLRFGVFLSFETLSLDWSLRKRSHDTRSWPVLIPCSPPLLPRTNIAPCTFSAHASPDCLPQICSKNLQDNLERYF